MQLGQTVTRTPKEIIDRYRHNRDWRLYEKEWVYHNFPPAERSWLDFGCGTGEITTQLALLGASQVIGVDVTAGLVEMTRRRAELDQVSERVKVICGDIRDLRPEPVDVVLSFAVLHHLPDHLGEAIPAIRRWLKPDGVFIAVEPLCYIPALEWLRQHSGVPPDALDSGERKLTEADLRCIERSFAHSTRAHFHCVSRLTRLFPKGDRLFRRIDAAFLGVPGARRLAGMVILVCRSM